MDYPHFGSALREWRGDMTQSAAATLLGMSQGQLSRLEHGQRRPSAALLWRMAETYGRSPADIVLVARLLADGAELDEEDIAL